MGKAVRGAILALLLLSIVAAVACIVSGAVAGLIAVAHQGGAARVLVGLGIGGGIYIGWLASTMRSAR